MSAYTFGTISNASYKGVAVILRLSGAYMDVIHARYGEIISHFDLRAFFFRIVRFGVLQAKSKDYGDSYMFELETPHFYELCDVINGRHAYLLFLIRLAGYSCYIAIFQGTIVFYYQNAPIYEIKLTNAVAIRYHGQDIELTTSEGLVLLYIDNISVRDGLFAVLQHVVAIQSEGMANQRLDAGLKDYLRRVQETTGKMQSYQLYSNESWPSWPDPCDYEPYLEKHALQAADQGFGQWSGITSLYQEYFMGTVVRNQRIRSDLDNKVPGISFPDSNQHMRIFHTSQYYYLYASYLRVENKLFVFQTPSTPIQMQVRLAENKLQLLTCQDKHFQSLSFAGSALLKKQSAFGKATFYILPIPFAMRGSQSMFLEISDFLNRCNTALSMGCDVSGCFKYFSGNPYVVAALKAAIEEKERQRLGAFYEYLRDTVAPQSSNDILDLDQTRVQFVSAAYPCVSSDDLQTDGKLNYDGQTAQDQYDCSGSNQKAEPSYIYGETTFQATSKKKKRDVLQACKAPIQPAVTAEFAADTLNADQDLIVDVSELKKVHFVNDAQGNPVRLQFDWLKDHLIVKQQADGERICKFHISSAELSNGNLNLLCTYSSGALQYFSYSGYVEELHKAMDHVIDVARAGRDLSDLFD